MSSYFLNYKIIFFQENSSKLQPQPNLNLYIQILIYLYSPSLLSVRFLKTSPPPSLST